MSAPTPEQLDAECRALGFALNRTALEGLAVYLGLLMRWNRVMNLVGTRTWEQALRTLLVDSFHLAAFLENLPEMRSQGAPFCLDLGAGAGLPGIPLRLLWQKGEYLLVETREKRAHFMQTVLAARPLPGVRVFHGRAEALPGREAPADCVVSRAFMPWEKVLDLAAGLLKPGGLCVFLALTPVPAPLPPAWTKAGEKEYTVSFAAPNTQRFFWALSRTGA